MPLTFNGGWTVVLARLIDQGPLLAVIYLAYAALASPLAIAVLILTPLSSPVTSRGRLIYAVATGTTLAMASWLIATPNAVYLALTTVGLFNRQLDSIQRPAFWE